MSSPFRKLIRIAVILISLLLLFNFFGYYFLRLRSEENEYLLQAVNIANTIIAFNRGFGINRQSTSTDQELLSVSECDLDSNASGNWNLPAMDTANVDKLIRANLVVDPDFIDAAAFDYGPKSGSYLDAFEHQALPVIIGYLKNAP